MKKIILLLSFLFFTLIYSQEEKAFKDFDYRLNGSFGMSFSSDWIINKPLLYVKTGFGFKFNKDFWFNTDVFTMRYASDRYGGSLDYYTDWTLAPNVSKDFNLSKKLKLVGSAGIFVTYETFSDEFDETFVRQDVDGTEETFIRRFYKESSRIDVGAIVGIKLLYAVKENLLVGLDFTGYAYLYLFLDNFLLGPTIEFRL